MFLLTSFFEPASVTVSSFDWSSPGLWALVVVALAVGVALAVRRKKTPLEGQSGEKIDGQTDGQTDGHVAGQAVPEDTEHAATVKPETVPKTVEAETKPGPIRARDGLLVGLAKTRAGFVARIAELLSKKQISHDLLLGLEEVLLTADIGPKTAERLFSQVRATLSRSELKDEAAVWKVIKDESKQLLRVSAQDLDFSAHKPFVLLVIGVNGVGKTTTIGKLAAQQAKRGQRVILAAGDTFRAAAVEQLEIWGQRAGVPVVRGKEGADPSSVIFEAIKRAQKEQIDLVIADTAGRLHVKEQLMAELQKIRRVIQKADPTAPHETWLVLDATQGQNAIAQARTFKEAMEVSGLVLTKLDGTAKGGVILGITNELAVPVRFIGVGEKIEDMRAFDADDFVEALYERGSS